MLGLYTNNQSFSSPLKKKKESENLKNSLKYMADDELVRDSGESLHPTLFRCCVCCLVTFGMAAIMLVSSILCDEAFIELTSIHVSTYWCHCVLSALCAFGWKGSRFASCAGFSISQQLVFLYAFAHFILGGLCYLTMTAVYAITTLLSAILVAGECNNTCTNSNRFVEAGGALTNERSYVYSCCVCDDDILNNVNVEYICGHKYHMNCIREWLVVRDDCLVCSHAMNLVQNEPDRNNRIVDIEEVQHI